MGNGADEGPRLADDVWIQVFLLLACMSAFFGRAAILREARRLRDPSGPLVPLEPAAAPAPGVPRTAPPRAPRVPGRWVVDARMGPDADAAALAPVLARAADGDSILLKPGVYDEEISLSRSVTIAGAGGSPDEVWLTHSGPRTVAASGARAVLRNLTLSNSGGQGAWVAQVAGRAVVYLSGVAVRSTGRCLRVQNADLDVSDSTLECAGALFVQDGSKVRLLRSRVAGSATAVSIAGPGAELLVERTSVQSSDAFAIEAGRFAKVRGTDASLSRNGFDAVKVGSGAEVRLADSAVTDNRGCGFGVDGGSVRLERVEVARSRCGVAFLGPGMLHADRSRFSELSLGPVAIDPGVDKEGVVVRGSGNSGLEIAEKRKRKKRGDGG